MREVEKTLKAAAPMTEDDTALSQQINQQKVCRGRMGRGEREGGKEGGMGGREGAGAERRHSKLQLR